MIIPLMDLRCEKSDPQSESEKAIGWVGLLISVGSALAEVECGVGSDASGRSIRGDCRQYIKPSSRVLLRNAKMAFTAS